MIGEARNKTTIGTAVETSLTGHLVYTTTHSHSVSNTIQRLLSVFNGDQETQRKIDILTSLRTIMVQNSLLTRRVNSICMPQGNILSLPPK